MTKLQELKDNIHHILTYKHITPDICTFLRHFPRSIQDEILKVKMYWSFSEDELKGMLAKTSFNEILACMIFEGFNWGEQGRAEYWSTVYVNLRRNSKHISIKYLI